MAEEEKPTAAFSVSTLTKYASRGYENTRDSIVVQPFLTVCYQGFSVNIWGNLDTRPYSSTPGKSYSGTWTETDLTFSYSKTFDFLNTSAGYIYYALGAANTDAAKPLDSQEVYVAVSLNKLLIPTLTVYKEIDHYHQWYFLLGISHTIEFNKVVSLKLSASASYLLSEDAGTFPKYDNSSIATTEKYNNFHDGVISIQLPINATKYITISPALSYMFPLCVDAKYEMKGRGLQGTSTPSERDSSFLYGGLTFDFSF